MKIFKLIQRLTKQNADQFIAKLENILKERAEKHEIPQTAPVRGEEKENE